MKFSKKILMIAPVSKDLGGSYTTGVAKVAESLMSQNYSHSIIYLSSSNINNKRAKLNSKYMYQYNGYRFLIFDIIKSFLTNPRKLFQELLFYKKKCHVNPFRFLFYRVNIEKQIAEIHPDIIHVHTTEGPAVVYANTQCLPVIITMHGFFYRGNPNQSHLLDRLKNTVKHFDYFVGLNRECRNLMNQYLDLNDTIIIPNGIESDKFNFDIEERNIIRKNKGVTAKIVFLTVASVQQRKGQLSFIKILQKLNLNWEYWIVGTGPDEEKIQLYCKENHLENKVILMGNVAHDNLYKIYSGADIYVHSSTMEGQALSEMEAYSSGLRIIINKDLKDTVATDINDKDIYYLLDMENPQYYNLQDWILKNNINRKSRKCIEWQEVADQYDSLYNSIN